MRIFKRKKKQNKVQHVVELAMAVLLTIFSLLRDKRK